MYYSVTVTIARNAIILYSCLVKYLLPHEDKFYKKTFTFEIFNFHRYISIESQNLVHRVYRTMLRPSEVTKLLRQYNSARHFHRYVPVKLKFTEFLGKRITVVRYNTKFLKLLGETAANSDAGMKFKYRRDHSTREKELWKCRCQFHSVAASRDYVG